jgi:hypothetical protein
MLLFVDPIWHGSLNTYIRFSNGPEITIGDLSVYTVRI